MKQMVLLALAGWALASCAPVPLEIAEGQCADQARLAQHPRGSISVAADSQGHLGASVEIGISSDFVTGQDPDQVYSNCVFQRSGLYPSRPFSSLSQVPG